MYFETSKHHTHDNIFIKQFVILNAIIDLLYFLTEIDLLY
jgi:hypothetical protein